MRIASSRAAIMQIARCAHAILSLSTCCSSRAYQVDLYKISLPQNCDFLQRNKKHGGLRDDELHFDRICFNFPHIGLGIKDQVYDVH